MEFHKVRNGANRARRSGVGVVLTVVCGCVLAIFSPLSGASAVATEQSSSLEAQRDSLFQKMLSDPSDLDAAFSYAALSTRLGDYEGAITALERMLIFSPGLPRVQLELGVLYYRLGSYATAETYFDSATSGDNVPDIVRQRVAKYVSKIKDKQQRHSFSGSIMSGLRVQSNANSGPGSSRVSLNGVTFTLNSQSTRKSDGNAFFAASLHYDFDLHQQGDLLEADFLFYGAKNFSLQRLDTAVAEMTVGPSFNLQRFGMDETQLGIYGIGNIVGLKDDIYFGTGGAGFRLVNRSSAIRTIRIKAEYRRKWYNNTAPRPTSTNRNGHEFSGETAASLIINPSALLHAKGRLVREDAKANFSDNIQIGGNIGVTFSLPSPINDKVAFKQNWLLDITGGYRHVRYDTPDPAINAFSAQRNNEVFVRSSLTIPVYQGVSVTPQLEYRRVNSNYGIYKYKNLAGTITVGYRF